MRCSASWCSAAAAAARTCRRDVLDMGGATHIWKRDGALSPNYLARAVRAHRSSQGLLQLESLWPAQVNDRRTAVHSQTTCSRQASTWSSRLLKSTSEYLFSDTLDNKVEVGVDDAGNRYYEVIRTFRADNSKQTLRIVEPASGATAADYDPASVPAQWQSWLSYSRSAAPTPDELLHAKSPPAPAPSSEDTLARPVDSTETSDIVRL